MARRIRRRRQQNAAPEPAFPTRLHPTQLHLIAKVRQLRFEANDLRSKVSAGSYGAPEREQFYKLAGSAGITLRISNPELAQRAGLGENFFPTLVRDRRYPKLENFLRALTAIIDVADERLFDIDRSASAESSLSGPSKISERIAQDRDELIVISESLAQLALDEIEKLDAEKPNDPDKTAKYERQRELLQLFANGFTRISSALTKLGNDTVDPSRLTKAVKAVESVSKGIERWWKQNGDEAVDWAMRIPALTAGVAALGWAGANMTVGTTAVAALIGGPKVIEAITRRASKKNKGPK